MKQISLIILLFGLTNCTPSNDYRNGALPFEGDYKKITQLELSRFGTHGESPWSTSLEREEGNWIIKTFPGGVRRPDRYADTAFVDHLLDTLGTLKIQEKAPQASKESLGLSPPQWAIRFTRNGKTQEVKIGQYDSTIRAAFIEIKSQVYLAKGALLAMFGHLKNFEKLRHGKLSRITLNDVVSVEVEVSGKSSFYAERLSGGWANKEQKKYKEGVVTPWLKRIFEIRIQHFIDQPHLIKMKTRFFVKPLIRIRTRDRHGKEVTFGIIKDQGKILTRTSNRVAGMFELYPESLKYFYPPQGW